MADVECSETLEWYSQQKSPYVFAIANIFTKRSNQTPRHRSHLCHDIMKFSCGWTDLMYPVWWNQEKGLSSTAHVDHTEVLQCRHNIKTLTTVKYEKSCSFFFVAFWSFLTGLLGLALLSEGLFADVEPHIKLLELKGTAITPALTQTSYANTVFFTAQSCRYILWVDLPL